MLKRRFYFLYALVIALSSFSGIIATGLFILSSFCFGIKNTKFGSIGLLGFVFVCLFSIFVNNPPSYFRVWERLAIFICTLLAYSPLIVNSKIGKNRVCLFEGLVFIMMIYGVASFIGFFFGINYFIRNEELLDYTEAGHFSGFTNHSMVLAPVSSLGGIYGLSQLLTKQRKGLLGLFWWGMTFMCFGAVLLSASRGSLGGLVLALVVAVYRYSAAHMGRFIRYGLYVIAALAISFPLWGGLTDYVIKKNDYNISQGGIAYSREAKMAARLYEIKNNIITGVGFSVVDEDVDYVDRQTGTIEPNSSWLGVFSMTGVFGFLLFLGIFIHAFYSAYKKIPDKQISILLSAIMGYFFVHMMIEGYVLAGGSFLCGTYWLTIGVIYSYSNLVKVF